MTADDIQMHMTAKQSFTWNGMLRCSGHRMHRKATYKFGTYAREQHKWMFSEMHSICNGAQHGALGRHLGRGRWNSGSAAHQGDLRAGPCPPCGQRPLWGSCLRSLLHLRDKHLPNMTNHNLRSICHCDSRIPTEGAFERQTQCLQSFKTCGCLFQNGYLSYACLFCIITGACMRYC